MNGNTGSTQPSPTSPRIFGELQSSERLVIVDVDTGLDDALATLTLLAADAVGQLKLKAITCVAGNTTLENVCINTLRILKAANRFDIPVFAGAQAPLIGKLPKSLHYGRDGFGDLGLPDPPPISLIQEENAVNALYRICKENKGKVDLICLAPLTNIALAMRTYPDFAESIRTLHIMGGNKKAIGNAADRPTAEFNFLTDPEAAHIVLEGARCPVHIVPWETCFDNPIEIEWLTDILSKKGGEAMQLLLAAEHLEGKSWVAWDQVAIACYLQPDLVRASTVWAASVELRGVETRGLVVLDHFLRSHSKEDRGNVTIVDAYDVSGFKNLILWAADRWTRL